MEPLDFARVEALANRTTVPAPVRQWRIARAVYRLIHREIDGGFEAPVDEQNRYLYVWAGPAGENGG